MKQTRKDPDQVGTGGAPKGVLRDERRGHPPSVSGSYAGLATNPATSGVNIFSGEFTADGADPTGHLTGTEDIGDTTGPVSGVPFTATYSMPDYVDGIYTTYGRGSVTMVSQSGTSGVMYVISPSKLVILPLNDPNPSVWLFEH